MLITSDYIIHGLIPLVNKNFRKFEKIFRKAIDSFRKFGYTTVKAYENSEAHNLTKGVIGCETFKQKWPGMGSRTKI